MNLTPSNFYFRSFKQLALKKLPDIQTKHETLLTLEPMILHKGVRRSSNHFCQYDILNLHEVKSGKNLQCSLGVPLFGFTVHCCSAVSVEDKDRSLCLSLTAARERNQVRRTKLEVRQQSGSKGNDLI